MLQFEFKSLEEVYIVGRGKLFIVEAFTDDPLFSAIINRRVKIDSEIYTVHGIESMGAITKGKKVGLLVK